VNKMKHKIENNLIDIQSDIINAFKSLESENDSIISLDEWKREEGGGGKTFVIENGSFFDKCAVNFSSIKGKDLPKTALANNLNKEVNYGYKAMGVSVISHPKNPNVPTSHMNVRLFGILDKNSEIDEWWIGGGYDLTPFIVFEDDIKKWHRNAKECLDEINNDYYPCFSDNCNNYFKIPHRNERRGVGGIFFDNVTDLSLENSVKMLESVANAYLGSYMEIANKRKNIKFSDTERDFQLIRRGRYVEFNLIYDRGTLFGLQSNGRIESILASLPNNTKWQYKKTEEYIRLEKELLSTINKDWNV
tara:strand:+ start:777 stop:1691 length:915 start_codon:yes stop_codon:yes gene_type:complete